MLILILRLLHIVLGALWFGFAAFVAFLLMPALSDAGPAAAPLMGALERRGVPQIMAALAGTTILAGLLLLWIVSGGFKPEYMSSHMGIGLSVGALVGIIAFIYGMTVVRPTMMKMGELSKGIPAMTSESERAAVMASVGALRARGAAASKVVAYLLLIALAAMAVARYL